MTDEKRNDEPFEEIPTTKRGIYKYDEESGRWILHRRGDGKFTLERAARDIS
jgi:hypothetical protein